MDKSLFSRESLVFLMVSLLFYISVSSFDPFLAPYITSIGVDATTMGIIIGAAGLSSIFLRFPVGAFSGLLNRRKALLQFGLLFTIVAWPLAYLFPSAETLFLGKLADGVTSATWVIYNVMFISLFSPAKAAAAIALLGVTSPVGSFIGITIAGQLTKYYGAESSFLLASSAALLALLLLTFLVKERRVENANVSMQDKVKDIKIQVSDKTVWVMGIVCAIVTMVPFATRDTLTPLLAVSYGLQHTSLAALSSVHLLAYAITTALCASFFYEKLGLVNTAVIGGLLQGVAAISMPYSNSIEVLFLLQALAGASFGMILTVLNSLIVLKTPPGQQAVRVGLYQSIYSAGTFFGPVLVGYLKANSGIELGFLVIGVVALASVFLVGYLVKAIANKPSEVGV